MAFWLIEKVRIEILASGLFFLRPGRSLEEIFPIPVMKLAAFSISKSIHAPSAASWRENVVKQRQMSSESMKVSRLTPFSGHYHTYVCIYAL